jgi:Protein of unknown function (DUF3833)
MRLGWLLISFFLAQLPCLPAHAQQLLFTPENGLSGSSEGDGSLRLFFGHHRTFHVRSHGQSESDGSFILKQTVAFEGQETQARSWTIRQVTPLHYTGTLSDAVGTVRGHTSGQRLSIKYRVKGLFVMHQILELMPDGQIIDNRGRITLLGIPVGFMHEKIRRGE